jgi:predicted nucleic acid-binding Zn ribbon protein
MAELDICLKNASEKEEIKSEICQWFKREKEREKEVTMLTAVEYEI